VGPYWDDQRRCEVSSHRLCALWSPKVYMKHGVIINVVSEANRARYLNCSECGKVHWFIIIVTLSFILLATVHLWVFDQIAWCISWLLL
jgi:hypothetical protein